MTRWNEVPAPEDERLDGGLPSALADSRLPAHDVAPERAERIRQQAHLLLRERRQHGQEQSGQQQSGKRYGSSAWSSSYHRFVEPAVLIGLGLWQLAWTVQDTVALFH
jgi:hypothetical protein